jgi:predicted DNA-binding transcriptional regulator AlpA
MSEQQDPSTLLRTLLIDAVREAVRAELQNFGAQPHPEDRLLDAEATAQLLSVSTEWLYHNSRRLPFTRKLGHKMLRFSYLGIQKYLSCRIASENR